MKSFSSVMIDVSTESESAERVVDAQGGEKTGLFSLENDIDYGDSAGRVPYADHRAEFSSPEPMFCDGFCRVNGHFMMQMKPTAKVVSTQNQRSWLVPCDI